MIFPPLTLYIIDETMQNVKLIKHYDKSNPSNSMLKDIKNKLVLTGKKLLLL